MQKKMTATCSANSLVSFHNVKIFSGGSSVRRLSAWSVSPSGLVSCLRARVVPAGILPVLDTFQFFPCTSAHQFKALPFLRSGFGNLSCGMTFLMQCTPSAVCRGCSAGICLLRLFSASHFWHCGNNSWKLSSFDFLFHSFILFNTVCFAVGPPAVSALTLIIVGHASTLSVLVRCRGGWTFVALWIALS
eukprot:RCo041752